MDYASIGADGSGPIIKVEAVPTGSAAIIDTVMEERPNVTESYLSYDNDNITRCQSQ